MTPDPASPCPCTSGLPYGACCGPFHSGAAEAPDATALMRSRYAAFAARQHEYLYRTLHPEHEDRQAPRDAVLRGIAKTCQVCRYLGLRILDARAPAASDARGAAFVLFHARILQRGQDCSFVEASEFRRAEGGWRYLRGDPRPAAELDRIQELTLERFARLR